MANYRYFTLDPDGRIAWATVIDACNDNEAIAQSDTLDDEDGGELWQEARRIKTYEPKAHPSRRDT